MLRDLVLQLDNALPQTQCTQCGFQGCLPYAQAMAAGQADINRCPPGGTATIAVLAGLLNKATLPLDPSRGQHQPRHIANIDPSQCIGCTLCIAACPVDAIIGSNRHRHAVLAPLCTGCGLCIPPCPVDCIDMHLVPGHTHWTQADANAARSRLQARQQRVQRQTQTKAQQLADKTLHPDASALAAVLARVQARRQSPSGSSGSA